MHNMASNKLALCLREENHLLEPCWTAGERKYNSTNFSKSISIKPHEIEAVDVIASCERITNIIDDSQAKRRRRLLQLDTCQRDPNFVQFRDIARLTMGLSYIFKQQVDSVFADAKLLLSQMKRTNFDLTSPLPQPSTNRKRKRIITKKLKITVEKRPRLQGPEQLDAEYSKSNYFSNLLDECGLWNSGESKRMMNESIETARMCHTTTEHNITIQTITEDVIYEENMPDIIPTNGFDDVANGPNDVDLTIFEELFPRNSSLKRKSDNLNLTDILCFKVPRLEPEIEFQANAGNAIINSSIELPSTPLDLQEQIRPIVIPTKHRVKPTKLKKPKLIIDKKIKYSRAILINHRIDYRNEFEALVKTKSHLAKPKTQRNANELLSGLSRKTVHQTVKLAKPNLTNDQMKNDNEMTLRAILGDSYTDVMAKQILDEKIKDPSPMPPTILEELTTVTPPMTLEEITPAPPPTLELELGSINNNNDIAQKNELEKSFDSHSVMMKLLGIWRNNPEIHQIDAEMFISSYPDRIQKSLAFRHLLDLARFNFICISKKEGSLRMHNITLGKESNRLIENIAQTESL